MAFSIAISGLSNVGKSTLFKILTKREVEISPRKFTTLHPNIGKVPVFDQRLEFLAEKIKPEIKTSAFIEFYDIAGLIKGAHLGIGLGNQFLGEIKNCDGVLFVLRCFENPEIENLLGKINPREELEILKTEFLMKDLETIERAISKLKGKDKRKLEILEELKKEVAKGTFISDVPLPPEKEKEILEFNFLTKKPYFCLLNWDGKTEFEKFDEKHLVLNLKEEEEFLELSEKEKKELNFESKIEKVISACYKILNLITFFTIAKGKEIRAWEIKKGSSILLGAKKVHSDFAKKFKRAQVINFAEFSKIGDWKLAQKLGKIEVVGKDYILKEGDIVEFKI